MRGTRGTRPALRQALGDPTIDPLPFHAGVYRLDPDLVSSDFRRLLAGRDAALDTTFPEHRVTLLRGPPRASAAPPSPTPTTAGWSTTRSTCVALPSTP